MSKKFAYLLNFKLKISFTLLTAIFALFFVVNFSNTLIAQEHPTCPEKVFDSGTETGIFLGAECGDFCHIFIKRDVNNTEEDFLAGGDSQEFDAKPGTKVKYDYDRIQTLLFVETPDDGECIETSLIKSIQAVK
jgi:hypothetical protein